jgi:hypothetical protein
MATTERTNSGKSASGRELVLTRKSGRCHMPHTSPTMREAESALRVSCRCGTANPRHPSSSPRALPGKIEKRNMITTARMDVSTVGTLPPSNTLIPKRERDQERNEQYH